MAWFGVKLLFRSYVDDNQEVSPLCEESFRLVIADDEASARLKSKKIAVESEHSYLNDEGVTVRWKYEEIQDLQEIDEDEITDGIEVFSHLYRETERLDSKNSETMKTRSRTTQSKPVSRKKGKRAVKAN